MTVYIELLTLRCEPQELRADIAQMEQAALRVKNLNDQAHLHANQKPLALLRRQIEASTLLGDVVWELFGVLMAATVTTIQCGRRAHVVRLNH